jgi:hypothetical protein
LLARALLGPAQNRHHDAIAILRALRQEAEATDNHYRTLCLATQLSETLLTADEAAEASQLFHEVLSLAAPAGLYQTIWMRARKSARCYYASKTMRNAPEFPAISCLMLVT